jgi:prepilin-type N-terminal cleavage/methylation domain-containing protein
MTAPRDNSIRAFTIMELLVVIAIIGVVAGLVVGLAAVASSSKNLSRTKVERDRLVTLINSYQAKLGVYPRDNTNNPAGNSLFYELAGAIRDVNNTPANPTYITPFGNIQASVLNANFRVNGIQNAVDIGGETNQVHRLLKDFRPDQVALISGAQSLVVPVDGPKGRPNPWHYLVGDNAVHNKDSFDLWVDIIVRGKTNTIGNWKD